MQAPQNHVLVIFGASGDLTKRKLLPALFELYCNNLLPEKYSIIGVGRTALDDALFREKAEEELPKHIEKDQNDPNVPTEQSQAENESRPTETVSPTDK